MLSVVNLFVAFSYCYAEYRHAGCRGAIITFRSRVFDKKMSDFLSNTIGVADDSDNHFQPHGARKNGSTRTQDLGMTRQ